MKTPCNILKTFQYSEDGIAVLTADKDKVVEIPNHLVSGFEKEGLLRPNKAGSAPAPSAPKEQTGKPAEETEATRRAVDITGWREMDFNTRKSLASRVSPTPVRTKDEVDAALEAEEKIRADLVAGNAS